MLPAECNAQQLLRFYWLPPCDELDSSQFRKVSFYGEMRRRDALSLMCTEVAFDPAPCCIENRIQ